MTQPTLRTESLFQLTWPIFLQQTTQSVVFFVDFWFFSHLSDEIAATVGQLLPVVWIGAFVLPSFAGAGVSVASQYLGARQHAQVIPAYLLNLLCTAGMGLAFAALLWSLAPQIVRWMGLPAGLAGIGTVYLTAMSGYFVFLGVLVGYNAVLSSRGMTQWMMYNAFIVSSLNLVLASLFVLVFHWGIRGVAFASITSVATAATLAVWLVHRRLQVRFRVPGVLAGMAGVARPLFRIAVANSFEPFSYTVQQIILSAMIISLGVDAMAANAYASRVQMFQITFSLSLGLGAQILMAHWMGARRFDDVNRLYGKVIARGMVVAGAYACAMALFWNRTLGIFTQDPAILRLGRTLLLIAMFYEPARAVNIIGGFALKTVGDARFPLVVAIVFIWGILPVVFAINHAWTLTIAGFWLCFATDEIVRAGINLWRWRTGRWKSRGIVRPVPVAPPGAESSRAGVS